MTRDEVKNLIVQMVTDLQGVKATKLAAELIPVWLEYDAPELFEELVEEGQLVEIEYVLPEMNFRCKSFYFPKVTKVTVENAN